MARHEAGQFLSQTGTAGHLPSILAVNSALSKSPFAFARFHSRPRVKRVNVRWLCLRPPDQLDQSERDALQDILDDDERLASGYDLLQRFRRLVARRSVRDLDQWLADAAASALRPFVSLSHGIQADLAAVVNGLTLPWSTGPVEGTVTKAKLLKR